MPSKSGQKRAQGGGRTANSEPRLQVFKEFNGLNFEHSPHLNEGIVVDRRHGYPGDQTDLQMNFTFLQNNVATVSNKTMETRDDIVELFSAPDGREFTGPVLLFGAEMYAAMDDGSIHRGNIDEDSGEMDGVVSVSTQTSQQHTWSSFVRYDDKVIALTREGEIFVGPDHWVEVLDDWYVENSPGITDPTDDLSQVGDLIGVGDLSLSATMTQEKPFRIEVAYTYVNEFGPTKLSPRTVFYANHPVSEWHAGCFLRISGQVNPHEGTKAVELYFAADNAMEMLFMGRAEVGTEQHDWTFDWYGYIDATSMWPTANLITPTENYTKGVHASRVTTIDGRMYFWGDTDQPQRLYIGGNPGNLLSVSPGTGGGFVDVEPGTDQAVRHVCKYKTQSGNSIVTMLCDSPNTHREQRFNLVENTISLSNEQSMKSWQAEQVAGAVGCKSYDGVVVCQDGLYSISRYGLALTTMTMEYNSQIRTTYVSDPIKPVFTDEAGIETRLANAMLLELDGVIYMALGNGDGNSLDNVIFCYDIDLKAWWTHTIDTDAPILGLFHVDWEGHREGIGIVTRDQILMLPTTDGDDQSMAPSHGFLIQTAQLATQMPQQGWQYLSQLEFHFDRFVGSMSIIVEMVDMFGRDITVAKAVSEDEERLDYVVRMRVDQRVMSYTITLNGFARFRMTHFIARVYTLSNKVGQVWGFDDSISYRSAGDVHPTFKCYNDVRRAIFT